MATCIQTLTNGFNSIGLANNVPHISVISNSINAIYTLESSMDQSIFLNIRLVRGHPTINATLTIYRKETLQVFGTMAINRTNASSSFNILAGEYYICIRSVLLQYEIEITALYINYQTIQTLNPTTNYGFQCESEISFTLREVYCNKPLLYKLIDGALPVGLEMLSNGYITGTLPMLDTDEFNKDLPPSNTWYEKIHDNEYVSAWGRYYRFKVHLYLEGFYDKGVEEWFWISILNDFNKNLRFVDMYDMLEDNNVATFEDKVKLDTIRLCPDPCGVTVDSSGNTDNVDEVVSVIDGEVYKNLSKENKKYFDVEAHYTGDGDKIINKINNAFTYETELMIEMIILDRKYIPYYEDQPLFPSSKGNSDVVQYYIEHIEDEDNSIIINLKDSCMFQRYLKENGIDENIIIDYAYDRFDLKYIVMDQYRVDDQIYLRLRNNNGDEGETRDFTDEFVERYEDNYRRLPWTIHTILGYGMEVTLK